MYVTDFRQAEMHPAEKLILFRVKLLSESWKGINCQVLIKLWQK